MTELWPLQNSHKFGLLPLSHIMLRLTPLIRENRKHVKEQNLLGIQLTTHTDKMKQIGTYNDELLPFKENFPFLIFC